MLEIKYDEKSFQITYNNLLLIKHAPHSPSFKIGIGHAKYRSSHGHFKIKEKIIEQVPLIDFNILESKEDKIIILLFEENYSLKVLIQEKKKYIEIIPTCNNKEINRFWVNITGEKKEAIYGCGAQFSILNLKGVKVPLWVEEQGIGRGDPPITGDWYTTYYPQPTFISTRNFFCHVETGYYCEFDFRNKENIELYIWNVPEKIIIGKYDSILDTVSNLLEFLGRQPRLPDWAYDGIWLGIQGGIKVVEEKIEKARSKGIKVGAVWCQDWQGIRYTSFGKQLFWNWKFDENLYPDLPNFIKSLHEKGIKFLGYINPFLAIEGDLYKEAKMKGFCVKNKEGQDYYLVTTDFSTALLDLTNPDAIHWLKSVIKNNMIDIGMDGWMADYGEYLPTDAILFSGISAEEYHNKYPTEWAKLNHDVLKENNLLKDLIFFTRSGYSHASKYTMLYWAGDQLVNWSIHDGIPSVIPGGISLGVCGIGYYHFDIGGYTTIKEFKRDKEVLLRWAELAAFSMVMRTHEGNRPDDNWQFDSDDETLIHFSKMVKIHLLLKPYLKKLSEEYQEIGIPPFRGLFLHYPNDKTAMNQKYEYLLGRDLLIAPVIKPMVDKWKVYLPDDDWVHVWTRNVYKKGWVEVKAPIGEPPVFYRKNSEFASLFERISQI